MELWDAYDENLVKAENTVLVRGEPIPCGLFHLVCEILVKHIDGTYLLMQRDTRKHLGGMWEATAGGSALKGETPSECARRELLEETGILSDALMPLGHETNLCHQTHYFEFLCHTDRKKDAVKLQDGETIAYKWVTKDKLLSMRQDALATQRILKYIPDFK